MKIHISGDVLPCSDANNNNYEVYWGDLHCHSNISKDFNEGSTTYSNFSPDDYFREATERGLNFAAITDHSEDILSNLSGAKWQDTLAAAQKYDSPSFVPLLGYEVCPAGSSPEVYKNTNIIFRDLDLFPVFEHTDVSDPASSKLNFEDMADSFADTPAFWQLCSRRVAQNSIILPGTKHGSNIRTVEVFSTDHGHDFSDGTVRALETSAKLRTGLVGVSNNHALKGPDGSRVDYLPGPGLGALTGVLLNNLTRDSVFEAIVSRRTYAVVNSWPDKTGGDDRTRLWFSANGHVMGEEFELQSDASGNSSVEFVCGATKDNSNLTKIEIRELMPDGSLAPVSTYINTSTVATGSNNLEGKIAIDVHRNTTRAFIARAWKLSSCPFGLVDNYLAAISSPIWISVL